MARRALVFVLAATSGCHFLQPPPPLAPPPDLTFHEARLEQFKNGVLTHVGTAHNLQYVRDSGSLTGQQSVLKPLTGSMKGGVLNSGTAAGNTKSGIADLSDNVRWLSASGDQVDTPRCHIDIPTHTANGHDPIQLQGNGYVMMADGFVSHFAHEDDLYLEGHAHAVIAEGNLNMDKNDGAGP